MKRFSDTVLKSIFNRKGGNGDFTRTIAERDENVFNKLNIDTIKKDEEVSIIGYFDSSSWIIITNYRTVWRADKLEESIIHSDLKDVAPDLKKQQAIGVINKSQFSFLCLKSRSGNNYDIKIEAGRSYWGILQVLSFIAGSTKDEGKMTPQ